MKNPSALQHNVAISGNGVNEEGEVVGQDGTSKVSADLKPGNTLLLLGRRSRAGRHEGHAYGQ